MKRKVAIIGSILVLCGCQGQKPRSEQQQPENEMYLLYATPLADHPIWLQSKEGFDVACKELNIKCDWIGPKVIDTDKMEDVIHQGIIQKADGIITQGVIDKKLLKLASDAKIPVILVDSNIEDGEKLAYYGKNFKTQAELLLKEIEGTLGKQEKLYVGIQVAELNFKIAKDQIQEIENAFANHPGGFEIVGISESKSDKIRAQSEWMAMLREHPKMNVSINFAAESADACGEVASALNLKHKLRIYGVDDMNTTLQYIRKGMVDASIVTSFYEYGYQTVYQIYEHKEKFTKPKKTNNEVKLIVVNKDNIDSYKERLKE